MRLFMAIRVALIMIVSLVINIIGDLIDMIFGKKRRR